MVHPIYLPLILLATAVLGVPVTQVESISLRGKRDESSPGSRPLSGSSPEATSILTTINAWRSMYSLPTLVWDDGLAENAKWFAEQFALTQRWWYPDTGGATITTQSADEPASAAEWAEKTRMVINGLGQSGKGFNWEEPLSTQASLPCLIWRSNTKVGCGWAYLQDERKTMIVCRFDQGMPKLDNIVKPSDIDWDVSY